MTNPNADLNIAVTFRHTDATPALKVYAEDKFKHVLKKFCNTRTDAHIILDVQKLEHIAEAVITSQRYEVSAKETSDDLYAAIDKVIDVVDKQLRKQKEKRTNHRAA